MAGRWLNVAKCVHDSKGSRVYSKVNPGWSAVSQDIQAEAAVRDHFYVLECGQNSDSDARRIRLRVKLAVFIASYQLGPCILALVRTQETDFADPWAVANKEELGQVLDLDTHFVTHICFVYAPHQVCAG